MNPDVTASVIAEESRGRPPATPAPQSTESPARHSSTHADLTPRLIFIAIFGVVGIFLTIEAIGWGHRIGLDSYRTSGEAWNRSGHAYAPPAYVEPNLNPPWLLPIVFGPWARLPQELYPWPWIVTSALALAWTVYYVTPKLSWPWHGALLGWLVALGSVPSWFVWRVAQVTWVLLPLSAASWWAYRTRRNVQAGIWLGVLIAVKPFFALMALALGWRTCLAAGLTSLAIVGGSILVIGFEPWRQFLAVGDTVTWLWYPHNASFWGIAARTYRSVPWLALPAWVLAPIGLSAIVLFGFSARVNDRDARWALAGLATLLVSPLGWMHYLPLLIPVLLALWSREAWSYALTAAILLWWVPLDIALVWDAFFGSAVLMLWVALYWNSQPSRVFTRRGRR